MPKNKKCEKSGPLSKSEIKKVKKLAEFICRRVAEDPESGMVLYCAFKLQPFLINMRYDDRSSWRSQIKKAVEEVSGEHKIQLKPESKKIVMNAALIFLREIQKG